MRTVNAVDRRLCVRFNRRLPAVRSSLDAFHGVVWVAGGQPYSLVAVDPSLIRDTGTALDLGREQVHDGQVSPSVSNSSPNASRLTERCAEWHRRGRNAQPSIRVFVPGVSTLTCLIPAFFVSQRLRPERVSHAERSSGSSMSTSLPGIWTHSRLSPPRFNSDIGCHCRGVQGLLHTD